MIIVIGGDKGGTGKTTLAANLTVCLAKQGKAVTLVKTDNNNSISDWYEERKQRKLPLFPLVECFGKVESEIKMLDKHSAIVIVDTAGYDSPEFRSVLQCADLLISPVRPSSPTEVNSLTKLNGIIRTAQQLNGKLKANILFYRCKPNNHKDRLELNEYLTADPDWTQPLQSFITHAAAFDNAMNEGKGVHEMKDAGKSKAQIELILQEIGA
ncbi:nucleotide-binding protein [Citrobacter freundii]|uniref:nucleotide-binding protein n=1 Tax=Enterobacteriaceae TaxID=543 RepID=UPI000DEDF00A|nr:division plane positioning ATPase MipZ [Klebsiella pneumoniae]MCD6749558.1 AAA family ATPase [Escherichia coli]HBW8875606.1 AAA family ATPase [Klebsiella quasipneumoniae subsp. similipneumoniae]HCR3999107.1 AAA family ATPase [Citrobacter freundii]HDL8516993.1 AAA family ATPase [Yersinia enterocolitica]MDX7369209.1 division plane positioning ATPase MipZ [Klebsiella pneumoniae]